jgi:nucleoprotein TPR
MGELNKQISTLTEEKRQSEAKVSSLEQENSTLQASLASKPTAPGPSSAPASVSSDETEKLNSLIVSDSSILRDHWTDDFAVQTSLRAERDKLLAEKESWNKPSGSAPAAAELGPAPSEWEAEKTQLLKARDEALEKLKV